MRNIQLNTNINVADENVREQVNRVLAKVNHVIETLESQGRKATVDFTANPMNDSASIIVNAKSEDFEFQDILNSLLEPMENLS